MIDISSSTDFPGKKTPISEAVSVATKKRRGPGRKAASEKKEAVQPKPFQIKKNNLPPLDSPEFEIKGVKFMVTKLNAIEGEFAMTEWVFPALQGFSERMENFSPMTKIQLTFELITGFLSCLDRSYYAPLQEFMFERTRFQAKNGEWFFLTEDKELAFQDMEAMDVFAVTVRCFMVNFTKSLLESLSLVPSTLLSTRSLV